MKIQSSCKGMDNKKYGAFTCYFPRINHMVCENLDIYKLKHRHLKTLLQIYVKYHKEKEKSNSYIKGNVIFQILKIY